MSVGTPEILVILLVALLVFGPHRLPDVARQVGTAMREMRRIQDTVRGELDMVLHPEHGTSSSDVPDEPGDHLDWSGDATVNDVTAYEEASSEQAGNEVGVGDDADVTAPHAADFETYDTDDPVSDAERRFLGPPDSFI